MSKVSYETPDGNNAKSDLLDRLSAVAAEAKRLGNLVEEHADELPQLLLTQLHVDADKVGVKLTKHRAVLEAARKEDE